MSIFSKIRVRKPKRSTFNLSHSTALTTEFGRLTPFLCQEILPGDSFRVSSQVFCRVAPMVNPILSNVDLYVHYFFVPTRLLWDKWEEFITGGEKGTSFPNKPCISAQFLKTQSNFNYKLFLEHGSLADYLGLGSDTAAMITSNDEMPSIDMLPFLAYNRIYNDYYRDENVQNKYIEKINGDGANWWSNPENDQALKDDFSLKYRCYKKDYFTSALPFAQRGPEVVLPFEGELPVKSKSKQNGLIDGTTSVGATLLSQGSVPNLDNLTLKTQQDEAGLQKNRANLIGVDASGNKRYLSFEPKNLVASVDSSDNFGPTINELRRSVAVQRWLEASARGGARLIEQIFSHFGVRSSDARLQRAEYLGGGKSPILVSEVLQQSQTSQDSALGTMAGHGVSAQNNNSFKRYFEEHGFIIGILSIMPTAYYFQGIPKMFTRKDKFDYAFPEFGHLGEQPILKQELFMDANAGEGENVFGYTPRYAEYKYVPNQIHGDFRGSLINWTTAREFETMPGLSDSFLKVHPLYHNDIFAYKGDYDHFWVEIYNNISAKRCLPYFGTPSLI